MASTNDQKSTQASTQDGKAAQTEKHVQDSKTDNKQQVAKQNRGNGKVLTPWVYDLGLGTFNLALDVFFREIYPRNTFRIPKKGPVIIVGAPHANQFADSIILMRLLKQHVGRRMSFLVAEKSMKEPYIGAMAGKMGSLPVTRAMDHVKPGQGYIYLPDPEDDPTLIRGMGTNFLNGQYMHGGSIIMPKRPGSKAAPESQYIEEILGPREFRLREAFKTEDAILQLTGQSKAPDGSKVKGTKFKIAPHIDQNRMFDAVYRELSKGACVGIFPEGGSHDRSDLLPLKAGVAIMALGCLARDPDCGLTIIPAGMNYFHAHKFRSRAVIEFGNPIDVHPDQVKAFKAGGAEKRDAIGSLLETIYEGLAAVTQPSPDHETLQLIQATRRLYNPPGRKLPLPVVIEFNRRLLKGYTKYQDDPRVGKLKKAVVDYNRHLRALGIKDHQVEWGDASARPWWWCMATLLYRLGELLLLALGTLPGILMFWPVFVTSKMISIKKQKKALAGSVVKLQGHDVMATWKILVAMALAPALYVYYTALVSFWLYYNRVGGQYTYSLPWYLRANTYIPDFVPLWQFSIFFFALMVSVSLAALRIGEIGMDILKSLPPLFVALNPASSASLTKLRAHRNALAKQVRETTDAIGPDVFPGMVARGMEQSEDEHEGEAYQSQMKRSSLADKADERSRSRGPGPFWWPDALTPASRSTSFSMESWAPERRGSERRGSERRGSEKRGRGRTQEQSQEDGEDNAKVDEYIDYSY
jgi:glycerol-3-phosphate O-acyltransferase/dihydroxyacetone phosphate acyltransferase